MLAYVFWHWLRPEVAAHRYQQDLITYHQTLYAHKPSRFYYTRVLLAEQATWLGRSEETYEDWHLMENSAVLDPLNKCAVSGPCQEPHRQIAQWTQGSAGGLYRLVSGEADLSTVYFVYRWNKPAGMTYSKMYELLEPLVQSVNGILWTRQMNLGPGPEFCLQSPAPLVFPDLLPILSIPVQQICLTLN